MASRQYEWQEKQAASGHCRICGKPATHYIGLCDDHAIANRLRNRKRQNCEPWRPGSVGRPPKVKGGEHDSTRTSK